MSCYRPLRGHRVPGGQIKFTDWPDHLGDRAEWEDRLVSVSCGSCVGCLLDRSRDWAGRAVVEARGHARNSFVTCTYDDEHLPEDWSLDKTHFRDFVKRARAARQYEAKLKNKKPEPFRYLMCGEYGGENARPHYHACVFGEDFARDAVVWSEEKDKRLWRSAELEKLWQKGMCIVGELTYASAAYVARYVMKKALEPDSCERVDPDTGECWTVEPEYVSMSRRPGLGKRWIAKYVEDVYPDDFLVLNGKKHRTPKYFDRHLESADPEALEEIKRTRVQKARKHAKEQTRERLETREGIARRKMSRLQRS